MQKTLFVLSVLAVMSVGCNRNQKVSTDSTREMQQEEFRNQMDEENESMPHTSPSSDQAD